MALLFCIEREADMEFRRLGECGLEVSVICLGTMMFGDRTDAATARRIISSALDAGVNFIDTADVYAKGASETIVGEAIDRVALGEDVALGAPVAVPLVVRAQPVLDRAIRRLLNES